VLNYQKSVQVARLLLDTIFLYSAVEPVWIDVLRGRGSIYMFRHFSKQVLVPKSKSIREE
jgi:hypothetical protein